MNEEPIFTAEQFRAQAAELQQAVAELHRGDQETIDPQNPFENETEFHHYNQDYGYIVPQIRLPGCRIPVKPNKAERSRIRRYYNIAGFGALAHLALSNVLAFVFIMLYYALQSLFDSVAAGGTLPDNYDLLLENYFTNNSSNIAMNLLIYMISNVAVALIGCKWSKVPISSLLQTTNLSPMRMISYIFIAIGLQQITGYLAYYIMLLMESVGVSAYEADFSTTQDIKSVMLMAIYTCIVAPVTEELLFRGFFLKNLSRVSQRFGIIASAVLFGLWHENIAQFVLAFFVGIFMGYITVKHNSIIPSILAHAAVNTASELFSLAETYGLYDLYSILDYIYLGVSVIGIILLLIMLIRERLPYTTPHQAERSMRLALTSIPLVLAAGIHIVMIIVLIMQESGISLYDILPIE